VVSIGGRRDHNIVFTSDMVPPTASGTPPFVVPTQPAKPQGKKAFFWAVNKHPHPLHAGEKFVALAIVQDHRRGAHLVTSPDGIHWSCVARSLSNFCCNFCTTLADDSVERRAGFTGSALSINSNSDSSPDSGSESLTSG
jgi:hypothetical protein